MKGIDPKELILEGTKRQRRHHFPTPAFSPLLLFCCFDRIKVVCKVDKNFIYCDERNTVILIPYLPQFDRCFIRQKVTCRRAAWCDKKTWKKQKCDTAKEIRKITRKNGRRKWLTCSIYLGLFYIQKKYIWRIHIFKNKGTERKGVNVKATCL